MGYEKLTPVQGGIGGCTCGYQHEILPLDAVIAVGFGFAQITKDGDTVYDENDLDDDPTDGYWTCQRAEEEALKDPDKDWRIHLISPTSERHYQRQGVGKWVLYEKGNGFAQRSNLNEKKQKNKYNRYQRQTPHQPNRIYEGFSI